MTHTKEEWSYWEEAFKHCRIINDVDSSTKLEDLKIQPLGKSFYVLDEKPSLDALGFTLFHHPEDSARQFYRNLMIAAKHVVREVDRRGLKGYYFNVANMNVAKHIERLVGTVDKHYIYEDYVVCYKEIR